MRIIATSDLHGNLPTFPAGDLLIVAGDLVIYGSKGETLMFARWLDSLPFEHIVVIAGNHDKYLTHKVNPFKKAHYLLNSGVEIKGLKIWGSPYTPKFQDWFFMKNAGEQIREIWNQIPSQTDILVTHGPPAGRLDLNDEGRSCGDRELMYAVQRVKPKYHIFGHIHESFGMDHADGTTFMNCSYVDEKYRPQNRFQIIEC